MGYSGNQLSDGGHFFAVQQLLLGAAKIIVGLARLIVQKRTLNGAGNLAANGDQQVDVSRGEIALRTATYDQTADDLVFGPKNDYISGDNLFQALNVLEHLR